MMLTVFCTRSELVEDVWGMMANNFLLSPDGSYQFSDKLLPMAGDRLSFCEQVLYTSCAEMKHFDKKYCI